MTRKMKPESRMFKFVTHTSNAIYGCHHGCVYCFARKLAEGKLANTPKYAGCFDPRFEERELRRRFPLGTLIFVSDMGDAFGDWVPAEWILKVLRWTRSQPKVIFLLLTKNPHRYFEFLDEIPCNCVVGATIESNRNYSSISAAPSQFQRLYWMTQLAERTHLRTFISLEPILDFDLHPFERDIHCVKPWGVAVGYDNYGNNLPEPPLQKTEALMEKLREYTQVFVKTLREGGS